MEVIPSIDISRGRCVKRVKGVEGTGLSLGDPLKRALEWERLGARRLHVIDLDGAAEGRPANRGVIERILEEVSTPIQVGGGIRSIESALGCLEHGASWIIIGTSVLEGSGLLEDLVERVGGEKLIVALDYDERGCLVGWGWRRRTSTSIFEHARRLDRYELSAFLCTYTPLEGTTKGIDSEIVGRLVEEVETPIIYAGGIRSIGDVLTLKEMGVWGAVVGMALYLGKIDFREALSLCL
ncbi:MAG TPA: 1-(5-phosphoribosyl)-5-[(5-phosphoribosylamino)methylideneamino] imidazole-4-carboxamide isomerase [Nitrososphaeria archaeon]|nr:1-(5-phosphoribosyl)-5-[(5-phosphoribosylamino)methylideneamino] imidazole-4-carboxamide isomerase [Nitrososphaeria archaeon]